MQLGFEQVEKGYVFYSLATFNVTPTVPSEMKQDMIVGFFNAYLE